MGGWVANFSLTYLLLVLSSLIESGLVLFDVKPGWSLPL
jgi:hypothetical protein